MISRSSKRTLGTLRAAEALSRALVLLGLFGCGGKSVSSGGEDGGREPTDGRAGGGTSAGGSSAGGSSAGGSLVGGTGPAGSGFGGSAGVPTDCEQPLPNLPSGCDYQATLRTFCARSGCHNATHTAAGLNLTPDNSLIARILNVPAPHVAISCRVGVECDPVAPACEACSACPSGDYFLDKASVDQSFILTKIGAFTPGMTASPDIGCGVAMPPPQLGAPSGYTQSHKDCLIELFRTLADVGRPCVASGSR